MEAAFDHLAVACETLEEGVRAVEQVLGAPLEPGGGRHREFGTHNRLVSLGPGAYLEVIAIDPGAAAPGRARWFDLDRFAGPPRLVSWVVRVADLAGAGAPGEILDLARGAYRWRMAVPRDGILPHDQLHPAMIEWQGPHPSEALPDRGLRLSELVLSHPEPGLFAGQAEAGRGGSAEASATGDAAGDGTGIPSLRDPRIRIARGLPRLSARVTGPGGDAWL